MPPGTVFNGTASAGVYDGSNDDNAIVIDDDEEDEEEEDEEEDEEGEDEGSDEGEDEGSDEGEDDGSEDENEGYFTTAAAGVTSTQTGMGPPLLPGQKIGHGKGF
jgi:hypothetical protein